MRTMENMLLNASPGDLIKELKSAGMTQFEIASAMGKSQTAVSHMERTGGAKCQLNSWRQLLAVYLRHIGPKAEA